MVEEDLLDVFFVGNYNFEFLLKLVFAVAELVVVKIVHSPVINIGEDFVFVTDL